MGFDTIEISLVNFVLIKKTECISYLIFKILAHVEGVHNSTRITINFCLNWRFWNLKLGTTHKIEKKYANFDFFQCTISKDKSYDISILISTRLISIVSKPILIVVVVVVIDVVFVQKKC